MKKTEKITQAMIAVVSMHTMNAADKLEVIEWLMGEKTMAEYIDKLEEEKNDSL